MVFVALRPWLAILSHLADTMLNMSTVLHGGVCRWYGSPEPGDSVFVERKTHRESWKGEESVKDRITLPKAKIVDFLDGSYTLDMAIKEGRVRPCPLFVPYLPPPLSPVIFCCKTESS